MMTKRQFLQAAALMKHGCVYEQRMGVGFFRAEALQNAGGTEHGFTARTGGVSAPPQDTLHLNIKKYRGDIGLVKENFRRFCTAANVEYASMAVINYEHGNAVVRLELCDRGRGFDREPLPPCDGLITNEPGVTLITNHADCGAFFLYDPVKRAVGAAHAGWKGTLGRIGGNLVEAMQREYGSNPMDILASTGPCICIDCYEVDSALASRFDGEFGPGVCTAPGRPGHAQLSIETAAAVQLLEAGIPPENITLMEKCTFEDPERLFSHRRDRNGTGDMAGYIKLT